MRRLWPILALAVGACHTAWDDDRHLNGPSMVLDTGSPEADASFDVAVDLVTQAAPDTDTDTAGLTDTSIPEGVTVNVDVELRVKDSEGEGTLRFLAWGDQPTDVVPQPFDFAAGSRTILYHDAFSCTNAGPCAYGRRASLDLRDGGPVTIALQVRATATAPDEWAKYVSDQTEYTLSFRAR